MIKTARRKPQLRLTAMEGEGVFEQPGTSGAHRAEEARRKALHHAVEAEKWQRLADAYDKGDVGERETARLLDILDGAGWVVLNDRYKAAGSSANIDHILVGPPGICIIDTKNWAGRVSVDAQGLSSNGRRRDTAVQQVQEAAALVAAVARQSVPRVITAPVLCFIGDVGLTAPVYEHGVVVLQADQLLAWLTSLTRNLQPAEVAQLGSALSAHFWPRTEPRTRIVVPTLGAPARQRRTAGASPRPATARPRGASPRATRGAAPGAAARPLAELKLLALKLAVIAVVAVLAVTVLPKLVAGVLTASLPHAPAAPTSRPSVVR